MSLITSNVPNLVNGVSQQPQSLRLPSQGDMQENGLSSISEGLCKRPAFRHVAKMLDGQIGDAFIHVINRDKSERYVVAVYNGDIRVFDIEGNEQTVNTPDGTAYLNSANAAQDFDSITVADYTFIVNKTVETAKDTTKSPKRDAECMFWIKQGGYGATYTIKIDGNEYSYETADGADAADAKDIATDNIATKLKDKASDGLGADYTVTAPGSYVLVRRTDGAEMDTGGSDSLGDTALSVINGSVQRFSDLPAMAEDGFKVEVVGDQTSNFDNYYMRHENGVWKETVKEDQLISMDDSTLPHALIREADGTFTFRQIEWENRTVGDLESNPFPSFIENSISGVFFHRNRFGVISGENVIMSKAGSFFDFFRGSATQVLDDDSIDVGVSHVKVSILRHAIPFNETLLLFSDQTQFQLGRANILTPDSVSINQTTEYETSLKAKPGSAGRFVYFMVNRGGYSGVREYYVDRNTEVQEASDVTGHVPEYIPGDVFKIASSSNEDALVLLSAKEQDALYIYRYYWSDDEKIQASWSKWTVTEGARVLNAEFIESDLYIVIERNDGVYLEVASIEPGYAEKDMPCGVHLDRLVSSEDCSIRASGDNTLITLPYTLDPSEEVQVVTAGGGTRSRGIVYDPVIKDQGSQTVLKVENEDLTSQPFYAGAVYEFRFRFSKLSLREQSGGGSSTVNSGRTQLRKMNLQFSDAGYFKIEVTPFRRGTYTYIYSGRTIGSARSLIGEMSISDGTYKFPIMARNSEVTIDIVNDSFLPASMLSGEWEAYFTTRSERM